MNWVLCICYLIQTLQLSQEEALSKLYFTDKAPKVWEEGFSECTPSVLGWQVVDRAMFSMHRTRSHCISPKPPISPRCGYHYSASREAGLDSLASDGVASTKTRPLIQPLPQESKCALPQAIAGGGSFSQYRCGGPHIDTH